MDSRLRSAYGKVESAVNSLESAQQELGRVASDLAGMELMADVCGGGEIEFRTVMPDGTPDDLVRLRVEDVDRIARERKTIVIDAINDTGISGVSG